MSRRQYTDDDGNDYEVDEEETADAQQLRGLEKQYETLYASEARLAAAAAVALAELAHHNAGADPVPPAAAMLRDALLKR